MKMEERDRLIQEEGITLGKERVQHLNRILLSQKRYEDLVRASEDMDFLEQLFAEFNI